MSQRPQTNFTDILTQSGVPVTEQAIEAELKKQVLGAGSQVSNDSEMSPFWRWVRAAVVTPTLWLMQILLVKHIMPNMFVATAERWALELKAWELNVTPKTATETHGRIAFTKLNADDAITVKAGHIIQTLPIDGVVYQVRVLEDTVLKSGIVTAAVPVVAVHAGAAFNLPAGYFNILPQTIAGIASVVNEPEWITQLGADAENDDELALRLQNAFTSSGSWHIDDAYRAIIASVAGIRSDNIYFENTGHIAPGSATAFIVMEVGATPKAVLDQLNHHITDSGHHGHGDRVTCKAIPNSLHDITIDLVLAANLTTEQKQWAQADVENRVRASFRETAAYTDMTRAKPKTRFSLSNMSSEIHEAMAVVESIKTTVDDQVQGDIISALSQPRINSITVREVSNG